MLRTSNEKTEWDGLYKGGELYFILHSELECKLKFSAIAQEKNEL